MMRTALCLLTLLFALASGTPAATQEADNSPREGAASVPVYLFWTATCPHCAKARDYLLRLAAREPKIRLRPLELDGDPGHERAFIALSQRFRVQPLAVPLILIGDKVFVGYGDEATTGLEIETEVKHCLATLCADVAGPIVAQAERETGPSRAGPDPRTGQVRRPPLPETVWLPGLGHIATRSLSLPALTIVLGVVDGFNPCAMWVLVFLIGLLVGMRDPVRMWSYGAAFLLTSAAVYFAFMAAWLNLVLLLGTLAWIRAAVGVFALVAGSYYLREFVRNPDAACAVTSPGERRRVMERLKGAVAEQSFLLAIAGIMALAGAVNLIELLCSAGIPAVYTQVLALSDLPATAYYGYLMLYIAIFMLDDAVVFITAMLTLQATGLAASYSRYSHLVGGTVLLAVGLLLVFRPEWLAFA
jgi:glutaredoxin